MNQELGIPPKEGPLYPKTTPSLRSQSLPREEQLDWLRLIRTPNVGVITFWELLRRYGSAKKALEALPDLTSRGGKPLEPYPEAQAYQELESLTKWGARLISRECSEYPRLLKAIEDAPPLLCIRGRIELLQNPILGIVGARNASLNGRHFATRLAKELGHAGYSIASGLARGIDGAVHEGSLETGTIGVIAGGIDSIYPPENKALYERMYEEGLILAEAPWGTAPQATHFPRRNRIISGISQGIIVIEAAYKSGSLITARNALDQGRDVFAVPGSPLDPRSQGTNKLIQDGCTLIQSSRDVLENLSPVPYESSPPIESSLFEETNIYNGSNLDDIRKKIQEFLDPTPVSIDELVRSCHNCPQGVWHVLLELELTGQIIRHPGNKVSKIIQAE